MLTAAPITGRDQQGLCAIERKPAAARMRRYYRGTADPAHPTESPHLPAMADIGCQHPKIEGRA